MPGKCTDKACTHKPFVLHNPEGQKKQEAELVDRWENEPLAENHPITTKPLMPEPHARQDLDIPPDPLFQGSDEISEAFNAIKMLFKDNQNQGVNTKRPMAELSRSVAQDCENRRGIPPMPSHSSESSGSFRDDTNDMNARARQLKSQVFDAGKADLFYTVARSQDSTQPKTAVLNIASLQHIALHNLQYDISCYVGRMYWDSNFYSTLQDFLPLTDLMGRYCQLICIISSRTWRLTKCRRCSTKS